MELALTTISIDALATQGTLDIEGVFEAYTLERPYTDGSVGGAIPPGRFPIVVQPSPHFIEVGMTDSWVARYARLMPHIIIPGRTLIMVHWGDFVRDTEGCVLVGQQRGVDVIGSSRSAFAQLYDKIYQPMLDRNCFLTVMR